MLRRFGFDGGSEIVKRHHIGAKFFGELFRKRRYIDVTCSGRNNYFVINISNVACIGHLGIERFEHPKQGIEDNNGPGITNVHQVIDCRTTDVHTNVLWINGLKY